MPHLQQYLPWKNQTAIFHGLRQNAVWPIMSQYEPRLSANIFHPTPKQKNNDISLYVGFSLSVLMFYKEKYACLTRWHYCLKYRHLSFFVIILLFFGQKWKCFNFKIWHNDKLDDADDFYLKKLTPAMTNNLIVIFWSPYCCFLVKRKVLQL